MGRRGVILLIGVLSVAAAGCAVLDADTGAIPAPASSTTTALPPVTSLPPVVTTTTTGAAVTTTTTTMPRVDLTGTVVSDEGTPLPSALVTAVDGTATVTAADGAFRLAQVTVGPVLVERPAWLSRELNWRGNRTDVTIAIEPRVVRGVRAIPEVAGDPAQLGDLLRLIAGTTVNALVFDTKDETGHVRYETAVERAKEMGAVDPAYDPVWAVRRAHRAGLYAITRIVTFEDAVWADDPAAVLAGHWVNPRDRDNWAYPIRLAVEACELGFDEVQFDYVRFPAGQTAAAAEEAQPLTADLRVEAIRGFLDQARSRLHPLGCAVSAAVFGIVVSSPTDEGIGQRPEELSTAVDVLSPMVYPSHYSRGWLGFRNPNNHPAAVTADALDDAAARVAPGTLVRPWLQGFYWTAREMAAAIGKADARGLGWLIWNAAGNYDRAALPKA